MVEETKSNAPVFKAKFGNCSGALWVNDLPKGKMLSATFQKYYKDKDGKDKNTNSFSVNDLPKLALCVEAIYKDMVLNGRNYCMEPENAGDL